MKILVIESVEKESTEWGVSFNGSNPEIEDYIKCISKDEALKLAKKINKLLGYD